MKKILSTTLVAIAFAMVSTVDAKRMVKKGGVDAKVVAEVATTVVDMPTAPEAKEEVETVLSKNNLSPDEHEYAVLEFQLKDTNDRIAFRKEQLRGLNYGIFGFFTATKEKKEEVAKINKIISDLEKDKKDIEADMAKLRPVVGSSFAKAIKLIALGVGIAGIATAIDHYFGGHGRAYVTGKATKVGQYIGETRVGKAAISAARTTRVKAGEIVEAGRGYAGRAYEKLPSMRRGAAATE